MIRSLLGVAALVIANAAAAQTAICYNCPPEWADWASQLKSIKAKTGITVPPDNKNSGQALAQLVAEKASPVADVTYLGVTFGIQAKKEGVVANYKPAHWNDIPAGLKDAEGAWFTIHSGTLGLMVNVDALKGKPVPKGWKDLLNPQYRGLVGYLEGKPVGWCAIEPRTEYEGLLRVFRVPWDGRDEDKTDDAVWAVTCLFARAGFRKRGVSRALARAAVVFARERGARAIEAYPIITKTVIAEELHVGTPGVFADAGLVEVSRPTARRLVMRLDF